MQTVEAVELAAVDRIELHLIGGFHEERIAPRRLKRAQRRTPDEVPAAGSFDRMDARLHAGHADGSARDANPRRLSSRNGNP